MVPLNDETRWILGRPNFMCIGTAKVLRMMGHQIAERAEDEQAAAIYWMLCLYENHGERWREVAAQLVEEARIRAEGKSRE